MLSKVLAIICLTTGKKLCIEICQKIFLEDIICAYHMTNLFCVCNVIIEISHHSKFPSKMTTAIMQLFLLYDYKIFLYEHRTTFKEKVLSFLESYDNELYLNF